MGLLAMFVRCHAGVGRVDNRVQRPRSRARTPVEHGR